MSEDTEPTQFPSEAPPAGGGRTSDEVAARVWAVLGAPRGATPPIYDQLSRDARGRLAEACAGISARKLARLGELAAQASASDPVWFLAQLPALDQKVYTAGVRARATAAAAESSARVAGLRPAASRPCALVGVPVVYERLDLAGRPDEPAGSDEASGPTAERDSELSGGGAPGGGEAPGPGSGGRGRQSGGGPQFSRVLS